MVIIKSNNPLHEDTEANYINDSEGLTIYRPLNILLLSIMVLFAISLVIPSPGLLRSNSFSIFAEPHIERSADSGDTGKDSTSGTSENTSAVAGPNISENTTHQEELQQRVPKHYDNSSINLPNFIPDIGSFGNQETANNTISSRLSTSSFIIQQASDTSPPTVIFTDPSPGESFVPVNSQVKASFNETIQSPAQNTFALKTGGNNVSGVVSFVSPNTAVFTPSSSLSDCTTYTATVAGVKDTAGNPMAEPKVWSFTTEKCPPDTTITTAVDGNGDSLSDGDKTDSDSITFVFVSSNLSSTFQCAKDGSSFKKCDNQLTGSGSQSYSNLKDGKRKFQVFATTNGVDDPSPASFKWTVKKLVTTTATNATASSTSSSVSQVANATGTGQVSPAENNVTIPVPGYGNVSIQFSNLTKAGTITVQAITSAAELIKTGIQIDNATGQQQVSMPNSQLYVLIGTTFDINAGDTKYSGPVNVTIPYNSTILSAIQASRQVEPSSQVRFIHYNDTAWNDETSGVDRIPGSVTGTVNTLGLVSSAVRPPTAP